MSTFFTGDATTERTEGPTPNGGAYAIAHFRDANGRPCPRARARFVEIHEFTADGRCVMRTYGVLGN